MVSDHCRHASLSAVCPSLARLAQVRRAAHSRRRFTPVTGTPDTWPPAPASQGHKLDASHARAVRSSCACPCSAYVAAWKLEASPQHAPPSTLPTSLISHQAAFKPSRLYPCSGITRSPPHAPQKRQGSPPSAALRSTVRYCSSPLRRPFPQGPQQARPCKPKCAAAGRPVDL